MSRRDPAISLRQMRDHAQEVIELVRGRSRSDLDSDRLLALALVRLLEIIGEAAGRVPADEQALRQVSRGRRSLVSETGLFTATTTSTTTLCGRS